MATKPGWPWTGPAPTPTGRPLHSAIHVRAVRPQAGQRSPSSSSPPHRHRLTEPTPTSYARLSRRLLSRAGRGNWRAGTGRVGLPQPRPRMGRRAVAAALGAPSWPGNVWPSPRAHEGLHYTPPSPVPDMTLAAEVRPGFHEVLGSIGTAGMGEVFCARDLKLRPHIGVGAGLGGAWGASGTFNAPGLGNPRSPPQRQTPIAGRGRDRKDPKKEGEVCSAWTSSVS
jgi:hypothetical protein